MGILECASSSVQCSYLDFNSNGSKSTSDTCVLLHLNATTGNNNIGVWNIKTEISVKQLVNYFVVEPNIHYTLTLIKCSRSFNMSVSF